jgi:membrane-associated phospholipid phosphatase
VTVAWFGRRWFKPRAASLLALGALLVTLATVYTRNHYAIDALAGALWGVAVQRLLAPALASPAGSGPRRVPASDILSR